MYSGPTTLNFATTAFKLPGDGRYSQSVGSLAVGFARLIGFAQCIEKKCTEEQPLLYASGVRRSLLNSSSEVVVMPTPSKSELQYDDFVRASQKERIYIRFEGSVEQICADFAHSILTTEAARAYPEQAKDYITAFTTLVAFAANVSGSDRLRTTTRSFFLPTDAIWHLDRLSRVASGTLIPERGVGLRFVWVSGRRHGTLVTPTSNFKLVKWANFGLCNWRKIVAFYRSLQSDCAIATAQLLSNPSMLALMADQDQIFLHNPASVTQLPTGCVSVHRLGCPIDRVLGTVHRVDIRNQETPGLQTYITVPLSAPPNKFFHV